MWCWVIFNRILDIKEHDVLIGLARGRCPDENSGIEIGGIATICGLCVIALIVLLSTVYDFFFTQQP